MILPRSSSDPTATVKGVNIESSQYAKEFTIWFMENIKSREHFVKYIDALLAFR